MLGAVFPEELGGYGYTYFDYVILIEELARVDPSIALSAAAPGSLCMNHIYIAGSAEQREALLTKLASGDGWIVVAHGARIRIGRGPSKIERRARRR